jgi:DNA-directed RNA polymerase specialized sigma24 family protein
MLRTLPERQREALVLRFYGGLSKAQAAAAMDVSATTLKACTTRGMAAWRRMLEQESGNEVPSKRSGDDPRTGHAVSR